MVAVPMPLDPRSLGRRLQTQLPQTLMNQGEFMALPDSTQNIPGVAHYRSEQPVLSQPGNVARSLVSSSMDDNTGRNPPFVLQGTPMIFQENMPADQINTNNCPRVAASTSSSQGPQCLLGTDSAMGLTVPDLLAPNQLAPAQAAVLTQTAHFGTSPGDPQMIVAKTTSAGLVQGILLPETTYYRRPDRPFPLKRHTILLDEPIASLDCGSEVVNPATGSTIGHIIQIVQCSRVQIVYIDSLADSVWGVNSRFDQEARLATLWYNKQQTAVPLQEEASTDMDGHGVEAIFRVPDFHSLTARGHASHACVDNEPAKATPWMASTPSPSQAKFPIAESTSSMLALAENLTQARRSGQSKPQGMQFIHYSASGGEPKKTALDDGEYGAQKPLQLSQHNDSSSQRGTSPSKLLANKTCPVPDCEYHKRGFRRRHDLTRHIITHYDGQMYCSFCPEAFASVFGQSFLRVEPLKRHLAAVHGAAKFRKTPNRTERFLKTRIKEYAPVEDGHCNVCARHFASATDLYSHIEGCVVRTMVERSTGCSATAADHWIPFSTASSGD